MQQIQTTIIGFTGKPSTVFSGYNEKTTTLIISVEKEYVVEKIDGCLLISNDNRLNYDLLFSEYNFKEAITAYFTFKNSRAADGKSERIKISDKAQLANPINNIQKDGMDDNGNKYRINEGITNAQVAVLATCWSINHLDKINTGLDFFDQLNDMHGQLINGYIVTI